MAIKGSVDLTELLRTIEVDVDPEVTPPTVEVGSLIVYNGVLFRRTASGVSRDLSLHAGAHALGDEDPIPTLPTQDQKDALDNAAPAPGSGNPYITENSPGAAFGTYYEYASSDGESSTTSETYIEKLALTTQLLPAGRYRFEWQAEIQQPTNNKAMEVRARVDGTTVSESAQVTSGQPVWWAVDGFYSFVLAAPATVALDVYYKRLGNTGMAMIRRTRLHIWRVE